MVEKQSKKFIVHFCFHFKAYIPVYPAYLWSLRWVYAVKKNPWYTAYTPQYTTGCLSPSLTLTAKTADTGMSTRWLLCIQLTRLSD